MDADLDPGRRASALRWGRRVLVVALLASGACLPSGAGFPRPAATITPTSPRVVVSALDECWAAIAPARGDDDGAVGAVAVLVPRLARASPAAMEPRTDEPRTDEPGTDERLGRELAVWAETVAGVYARLLIDVLSEQARPHLLAN